MQETRKKQHLKKTTTDYKIKLKLKKEEYDNEAKDK